MVALLGFDDVRRGGRGGLASLRRRARRRSRRSSSSSTSGMALVREHAGAAPTRSTSPHPAYLLVEAAADQRPDGRAGRGARVARRRGRRSRWPPTRARAAELWRYREAHTEAIDHLGTPAQARRRRAAGRDRPSSSPRVPGVVTGVGPGAEVWLFGHAADGNVHVNVTGVDPDDDAVDERGASSSPPSLGGSVSAEHGIGTAKRKLAPPQPQRRRDRACSGRSSGPSTPTACSTRASYSAAEPRSAPARRALHRPAERLGPLLVVPELPEARARPARAGRTVPGSAHPRAWSTADSRSPVSWTSVPPARRPASSIAARMREPLAGSVTTKVGSRAGGEAPASGP